jgi:hypothetical protein
MCFVYGLGRSFYYRPRLFGQPLRHVPGTSSAAPKGIPPFEEKWFTQTLDHFNFHTVPDTFQQRYLMTGSSFHHPSPTKRTHTRLFLDLFIIYD